MSDGGAYQDEMRRFLRLNDRDLDQLLAGRAPTDHGELDELAAFARELKHTFEVAPEDATEAGHLKAIMDAIRTLPEAETADVPTDGSAGLARRSRPRLARVWARPLVLAGAVAFALFCGVAYAGELPGPVQGRVADIAGNVGISLPGAHNDKDDGAQNDKQDGQPIAPGQTPTDTTGATETGDAQNEGSVGNRNDGEQANNARDGSQQHGESRTQNQTNDDGTNGNSGDEGHRDSGQGAHGGVGATPGSGGSQSGSQGGGTQGSGTQGGGDPNGGTQGGSPDAGSQGGGSQGRGNQGNGDN
jgi:hypothetical protein